MRGRDRLGTAVGQGSDERGGEADVGFLLMSDLTDLYQEVILDTIAGRELGTLPDETRTAEGYNPLMWRSADPARQDRMAIG